MGSPDLDLRPSEMQRSTMETWLQLCPHCGYCAPDISLGTADANVIKTASYRAALERQDLPELARRFFAYAITLDPSHPYAVANAFLHAAWVCDDAGRDVQAADCRQRSAEWFRRCKPFADNELELAKGAVLVDVLRRSSQFKEAASECASLLAAENATGLIRKLLEFQLQLIARTDRDAHLISDCEESKEEP